MKRPKIKVIRDLIKNHKKQYDYRDVHRAFSKSRGNRLCLTIMDRVYHALPFHVWDQVLLYNRTNRHKYVKDTFDCDDFAFVLKGTIADKFRFNGIGLVLDISGKHAYNMILGYDNRNQLQVEFVEPQGDYYGFKVNKKSSAMYEMKKGRVYI